MERNEFPPPRSAERWHGYAIGLIVLTSFLRLGYLMSGRAVDLSPDEAHYWDWSRQLDWSYYSKGPLVAWLIRASDELFGVWSQQVIGSPMLAVRIPAIVCGALTLWGLFTLARRITDSARIGFVVVVVGLVLPFGHALSLLMTIDAPFALAWTWALVLGHAAWVREQRQAWWQLGIVLALGILAKYTMLLLLGCMVLFLLITPSRRHWLFSGRFFGMGALAALGMLPIVWWNSQHDWVSFRHVATQAGMYEGSLFGMLWRWNGPFIMLGGQIGLLLGVWFIAWLMSGIRYRPGREPTLGHRYLWCCSVPVFAAFFGVSFITGVQANWPAPAYLAGLILAVEWVRSVWHHRMVRISMIGVSVLGVFAMLSLYDFRWVRGTLVKWLPPPTEQQPLPARRIDPTCRLRGWQMLGRAIDAERKQMSQDGQDVAILSASWHQPGLLRCYTAGHPDSFSLGSWLGDRRSQYDLWRPNPLADAQVFAGRSFVYVGPALPMLPEAFERVEGPIEVEYAEEGIPLARWQLWRCYEFRGKPWPTGGIGKIRY